MVEVKMKTEFCFKMEYGTAKTETHFRFRTRKLISCRTRSLEPGYIVGFRRV
jgi:hypothetical protein